MKTTRTPYKFWSRAHAFSFRDRSVVPMRVILGDDDMFWVVTPGEAAILERAGYELAA